MEEAKERRRRGGIERSRGEEGEKRRKGESSREHMHIAHRDCVGFPQESGLKGVWAMGFLYLSSGSKSGPCNCPQGESRSSPFSL